MVRLDDVVPRHDVQRLCPGLIVDGAGGGELGWQEKRCDGPASYDTNIVQTQSSRMPLSSNRYQFAQEETKSVYLRQMIGGYELVFSFQGSTVARREATHWLYVHSDRVVAKSALGARDLGVARPDVPAFIFQVELGGSFGFEVKLFLLPAQLAALEDFRNAGDLEFELTVAIQGGRGNQQNQHAEYEQLRVQALQSFWVAQLNSLKAADILLLEVPMPFADATTKQKAISEHLTKARAHFQLGNYTDCVTECRKTAEQLELAGTSSVWTILGDSTKRKVMSKDERIRAILATTLNFSHLSAHSAARGGTADFTRADAKLAMSLLAAFAAHGCTTVQ